MKKKTKKKTKKKITLAKAKRNALEAFSLYIRLRDSGKDGWGHCVTCNGLLHYKKAQAGHFIQGRRSATLFLETNCHLQCVQCNIFKHGNLVEYTLFMLDKYGRQAIDMLRDLNENAENYKRDDYLEIERVFKEKVENL